jgi:NAD(P)-dependent dehydrogenase (short-subunit alcohol dehydrogenase family)
VLELRDESWRRILDVNLTGMFIATQEAGRVMAARGRGAIVLMASTNAFYPEAHTAPYSTSKAGLVGFVRAASLRLGQHGIRINAVNPGIINTRLSKLLIDDPIGGPEYLRRIPLRRWGAPEPDDLRVLVEAERRPLALARLGEVLREDLRLDLGALAGHLLPEAHGGADELLVALALGDEGALALDLVDAAVDDQLAERLADDRARNAEALAQLGL